jgi:predicted O-methyltransferase YrrM
MKKNNATEVQSLKRAVRNWIGEELYGQLAAIKAKHQARARERAKKKLEAFEDSDVRKFYMPQSIPHMFNTVPEKRRIFDALWKDYHGPLTDLRDPVRLVQFMSLLEIANAAPEGDYLEIGTHRGQSAKVIFTLMDPTRTLFCIDTFDGFVERDLAVERRINPSCTWRVGNFLETSCEYVGTYVGDGMTPSNFKPIKGWFPSAYEGLEDRRWRFIHLDVDLYEPTRVALEMLWPKLVPGGVMVFHDYENSGFPGVKLAVDTFFSALGLTPLHMGDLWGSAMMVKPRPVLS